MIWKRLQDETKEFLRLESAGGILLIGAAAMALILANSPLSSIYFDFLDVPLKIQVGALDIGKPLLLWINDGLMAVFFLLVGLEVKREMLEGQLRGWNRIALPGAAAIGGMVVPAGIYVFFNWGDAGALNGWAIPTATDIAFALGVLALLGSRVPPALKLFLMALAIFDDLGAIVIIAIFYSGDLSHSSLVAAVLGTVVLFGLSFAGVTRTAAYVLVGICLWIAVLKSGVHATLAGVALAFAIPLKPQPGRDVSMVQDLEHALHPWVAFGILPIFAFANAGVPLAGMGLDTLFGPVSLGIAAGLFIGKQVGVFGFSWVAVKTGIAQLPEDANWAGIYGIAILCGIGFTMSLFIGSLAFEHGGAEYAVVNRVGILFGSLVSAVVGFAVLRVFLSKPHPAPRETPNDTR